MDGKKVPIQRGRAFVCVCVCVCDVLTYYKA